MYRLIDPVHCPAKIEVHAPQRSLAIVDDEGIAVAAVARCGGIVYANRVFLNRFQLSSSDVQQLNIRDILPGQGRGNVGPKPEGDTAADVDRIIELRTRSEPAIGSLLIAFEPSPPLTSTSCAERVAVDPEHPRFADAYYGLYVADPEAYTLKVNPSYEKIAFLPETELVGRHLRELEEKGYFSQSVTLRVLAQLQQGKAASITLFQRIITGKEVIVTGTPVFVQDGRLKHIVTLVRDIVSLETIVQKCEILDRRQKKWCGMDVLPGPRPGNPHRPPEPPFPLLDQLPVIAKDPQSLAVVRQAVSAARYHSPVLLTGETGVGKDLVAKYIHLLYSRTEPRPFVTVNCSAIPRELLESELFGYEEGAFSGARRGGKKGLFEQAEGGILFLNEISELPLSLQAKLLTALDEGIIRRLGGTRSKRVRTRIICATNDDLCRRVEERSFRSDLYYRIKVLAIHIPPLRERRDDILPLLRHFTARICRDYNLRKFFSPAAQETLTRYRWPGNVRELRNLVERLVVFSRTAQISVGDLPEEILAAGNRPSASPESEPEPLPTTDLRSAVRRYERELIQRALEEYGSFAAAARRLGVDPTTLSRKLRR